MKEINKLLKKEQYTAFFKDWSKRDFTGIPDESQIFQELTRACEVLGGKDTIIVGSFNYIKFTLPFVTENIQDITGHPLAFFKKYGMEGALSLYHPNDREEVFKFQKLVLDTFYTLSMTEKKRFEFGYIVRWIDGDKKGYSWYSTKVKPYYIDQKGNLIYDLNFVMKLHTSPMPPVFSWEYSYVKDDGEKVAVQGTTVDGLPAVKFSAREKEVIQLLASGKTSAEIAEELEVSFNTVHTHRKNIMKKIDANNLADVIKYAVHHGLL